MNITQYRYKHEELKMRTISMKALVEALRMEGKAKPVAAMRNSLPFTLPGKPNGLVQRLPVLVFGATYRRNGEKATVNSYTGYVLLEVNNLTDSAEAEEIRREAAGMPQTLLAFVGAGGRSVKIVIPFTLPNGSLPRKEELAILFHATAYQLAVKYLQPQLSSMIMLKEPLLSRGCRMSFDPDLYYNPNAVAICMEQPLQMPEEGSLRLVQAPSDDSLERLMPGVQRTAQVATLYSVALVEAIRFTGKNENSDKQTLFIALAQNCCRSGIPEEEAVAWTLTYEALLPYELNIRMTFRSAYLLKKLADTDFLPLPGCMQLVMQLGEFMERRYYFRMNGMSGETEYLDRSMIQFAYRPFTLKVRNSICLEAQKEGLNVWDKDVERYINSDHVPVFYPIESYIEALPRWDGKDHIRAMAGRISCSNTAWNDRFFRWFLSMVAHWLRIDQAHGNSTTPLLVGDQGCGKSTFCLNLLPPALRAYYTDSLDFSKRSEAELALHRYALINIDEFDSVKASHQSFLKHILQKAVVNVRLPYQSTARSLRRYATFIATSNNFDLLTDPTGSRRFICIEVEGVIDYLQPIDHEQLYAQAKELLMRGERYWFTHEEESEISTDNHRFQQIPAEEQLFLQYFQVAADMESGTPMLAAEILDYIALQRKNFTLTKAMIRDFGKLLKRNKVPSKRTTRGTCYSVIALDS